MCAHISIQLPEKCAHSGRASWPTTLTNRLKYFPGGSDYQPTTQVLTFTSSTTSLPVNIPIFQDSDVEGEERFVAELSVNAAQFTNVNLSPDTHNVIILDDDGTYLMYKYENHFMK